MSNKLEFYPELSDREWVAPRIRMLEQAMGAKLPESLFNECETEAEEVMAFDAYLGDLVAMAMGIQVEKAQRDFEKTGGAHRKLFREAICYVSGIPVQYPSVAGQRLYTLAMGLLEHAARNVSNAEMGLCNIELAVIPKDFELDQDRGTVTFLVHQGYLEWDKCGRGLRLTEAG